MKRGGPLHRRTWMKRGTTGLRRTGFLKRRTPLRAKGGSLFPHRRNPDYLAWIRTLDCLAIGEHEGPVESAHVKSRGAGGDDVGGTVPLCRGHHRTGAKAFHRLGPKTFERECWRGPSMATTARLLALEWGGRGQGTKEVAA